MSPDVIAPAFFLAAGLLAAAGVAKLIRPRPAAQAMADAGLPASDAGARAVGVVELGVGFWAVATGGVAASLTLAAVYLAFAGFLAFVLKVHPDAGSCGCAGVKAVPPSRLHLALNLAAAASAVTYALMGGGGIASWHDALGTAASVAVIAGLALAGWLALVVITDVPAAWASWRPPATHTAVGAMHGEPHDLPGDRHLRAEEALATRGIGPGHASLWPGHDATMKGGTG